MSAPSTVIVSAAANPLPIFVTTAVAAPDTTVIVNSAPIPLPVVDFCATPVYTPFDPAVPVMPALSIVSIPVTITDPASPSVPSASLSDRF